MTRTPAAAADHTALIGRRFADDAGRTLEVLHWSPRRPGLVEVRVVAAPAGDCLAGKGVLASAAAVRAMRPVARPRAR